MFFSNECKKTKSFTKLRLYLYAMRVFLMFSTILALLIIVCFLALYFTNYNDSERTLYEIAIISGIIAICIFLLQTIIFSLCLLPEFCQIAKQESYLGICFSDEMKTYSIELVTKKHSERKYQLKKVGDKTMEWFVAVEGSAIIVFKKDYVIAIERNIEGDSYPQEVIVLCADGEKQSIKGSKETILEFVEWAS